MKKNYKNIEALCGSSIEATVNKLMEYKTIKEIA